MKRKLGWIAAGFLGLIIILAIIGTLTGDDDEEDGSALTSSTPTATPPDQPTATNTRIPTPTLALTPIATPTFTPTQPPSSPTPNPFEELEVQSFRCVNASDVGFVHVEGEVTNISGRSLENVLAVGTWRTDDGTFITSDSALTDLNPILPGQSSPFKTFTTYNPAMATCHLSFQSLFGGSIEFRVK